VQLDPVSIYETAAASLRETLSTKEELKEADTGESIIVNVKGYEPEVVDSAVLEDDDIPIYVFLTGTSIGSLMGTVGGSKPSSEPFYGQPKVKSVLVRPMDVGSRKYIKGTPKYVRPNKYAMDSLGYLIVTLRQQEAEKIKVKAQDSVSSIKHPTKSDKTLTASEFCSDSKLQSQSISEISALGISNKDYCSNKEIWEEGLPDAIDVNMTATVYFENALRLFNQIQQDLVLPLDASDSDWRSKLSTKQSDYGFFANNGFVRAQSIKSDSAQIVVYGGTDVSWPYTNTFSLKSGYPTGSPRALQTINLKKGETSDYIRLWESRAPGRHTFRIQLIDVIDPQVKRAKLELDIDGEKKVVVLKEGSRLYTGSQWKVSSISTQKIGTDKIKLDVALQGPSDYRIISKTYRTTKLAAKKSTTDVCQNNVLLIPTTSDDKKKLKAITDSYQVPAFCAAIEKYKDSTKVTSGVKDEEGVLYNDRVNYRIGSIYHNDLQSAGIAKNYYEKAANSKTGAVAALAQKKLSNVKDDIDKDATSKPLYVKDNLAPLTITLKDVVGASSAEKPSFTVDIGSKTLKKEVGDWLLPTDEKSGSSVSNWKVKKIYATQVEVEKVYKSGQPKNYVTITYKLDLKTSESVGNSKAYIRSIDLKKFALVRILPGTGKALKSQSNFSLHIPIEKRAIQWTPDEIRDKINSTQEIIDDLNAIIDKLTSVVKTWKTVCLVTFAFLTIKNSFFTGMARTQARQLTMRGTDGK
jgi:hypothetical protein